MSKKLIEIDNLHKHYTTKHGIIKALDGVSLTIQQGEIIGLLGVNGAGKTTLSSILATLHPATHGDIRYNGHSIYADIPSFRHAIGFCPQKVNLNKDLTIDQTLWFAGAYYGLSKTEIRTRREELIQHYDLEKYRSEKADVLSGGYQRRVLFARALMHTPKLLILDEPTVGLDPHIRHRLWSAIQDLKEQNISVLLTTHYLDEADVLSDRICILDKGIVKKIETPQQLKKSYNKQTLEDVFIQLMNEEASHES